VDSLFIITRELYSKRNTQIVSPAALQELSTTYSTVASKLLELSSLSEEMAQFYNDFIQTTGGNSTPVIESRLITQLYDEWLDGRPDNLKAEFAKENGFKYENDDWVLTDNYKLKALIFKNISSLLEFPEEVLDVIDTLESLTPLYINLGDENSPIGYIKQDGLYVLDPEFGNRIQEYIRQYKQLTPTPSNLREISNLENLYKQYLKNKVLETMLSLITSKKSRQRMLAPISFAALEEAYNSLPAHLKQDNKKLDLSSFEDEFTAFSSLGSGQVLTGAFANSIKVFAYLLRAGNIEDVTELLQQYRENPSEELASKISSLLKAEKSSLNPSSSFSISIDGKESNFNKLRVLDVRAERDFTKGYSVTEVFDALVNAAIDNLNKQLISKMNINTHTGSAVTGMVSTGVPMDIIQKILYLPIFSPILNNEINNVQEFIRSAKNTYRTEIEALSDSPLSDTEINAALEVTNTASKQREDLETSLKALLIFEKANKIGEDMRNLASFLNIIRKFEVTAEGLDRVEANLISNIGTMVEVKGDYLLKVNSDFSFTSPNILKSSPHIKEAFLTYKYIQDKVQSLFKIHSPQFRQIAEQVKSGIVFSRTEEYYAAKELSNIRTSLGHYIMSNLVWPEVSSTRQVERKIEGTTIKYLPSLADSFSDSVLKDMQVLKSYMNVNKIPNSFLSHLSIAKDNYGRLTLAMSIGVNMSPEDLRQLMIDFIKLNRYSVKDGKVSHSIPSTDYELTDLHKRLLVYNVVKYGISYAGSGMSQIMPADLFRTLDRQFNETLDSLSSNSNLGSLIDHFRFSYILQNASRIPFSPTENAVFQGEYGDRVFSGIDTVDSKPVYFDRKLKAEKDNKGELKKYDPFVKISVGRKTQVFKLVLSTNDYGYYQKVGNVAEVFYSPATKNWSVDKVFNPNELTLRSQGDVNNGIFKTKENISHLIEKDTIAWVTPTYSFDRSERLLVKFKSSEPRREGAGKFPVYSYEVEVLADKLSTKYALLTGSDPIQAAQEINRLRIEHTDEQIEKIINDCI